MFFKFDFFYRDIFKDLRDTVYHGYLKDMVLTKQKKTYLWINLIWLKAIHKMNYS